MPLVGGQGAKCASSVNPITSRGPNYAHHITASPLEFENPAASLFCEEKSVQLVSHCHFSRNFYITGKNLVKIHYCAVIWASKGPQLSIFFECSRQAEAWLSTRWGKPAVRRSAGQYCATASASALQSNVKRST